MQTDVNQFSCHADLAIRRGRPSFRHRSAQLHSLRSALLRRHTAFSRIGTNFKCIVCHNFPVKKQKGPFSRKSTLFTWRNTTISCLFLRQRSRETQKRVPSADRLEALQFTRPKGICSISRLEIYILSLKIHIFKLKIHILRLKTMIHGPPASPGFRIISTPPSQARCDTSSLPHFSLSLSLHFKQIESGILCGIRHKSQLLYPRLQS